MPSRPAQPRLRPVSDPSDEQRELMRTNLQRDEQPLNIFATLAHNPGLLRRQNQFGGRFLFRGSIDERAREIVILRSAYRSRSVYEFGQHTIIGERCGLQPDEISRLARSDVGEGWSPAERRLITMVDELSDDDCVTDETWAGLRADYDDGQLVEVLLLPGYYRMIAGFLNSAGVELEDDAPGWPDGVEGLDGVG